jgi:signal peptidase I
MPPLMDAAPPPSLTETLANLNILWILAIVAGLTVLRLALIRRPSPTARSLSELSETGLIALALVYLIIRPFFVQAFYIPTASMEPTLLGNSRAKDRILVSKFQYRLHPPQRDEVVVFLAPSAAMAGNPPFVKRLIGLPGDRVESVAGFVLVGAKRYSHADIRQALAGAGAFGPEAKAEGYADQADHHVRFVSAGVLADKRLIGKEQLATILSDMAHTPISVHPGYNIRNGMRLAEPFIAEDPDYDMKIYQGEPLKHEHDPSQAEYKWNGLPITAAEYVKEAAQSAEPIPAGHYLMMGDNRNDSNDGTNWGPLEAWRVVGPARVVFWPPADMGGVH